jgi:preprotein translocase subunit SecG
MLFLNIIYVLLAVGMIALILMQRGSGAQAGSGFGGGASGTVFGARGSANFLSKATKWMAITFFAISLLMAWQATRDARPVPGEGGGLMSAMPAVPAAPAAAGGAVVPSLPASTQPAAPAPASGGQAAPAATPAQTSQPDQTSPPTGG